MRSLKIRKKTIYLIILFLFIAFFGRILVETIKLSPVLFQYLFQKEIMLKKSDERINLLFLGVGGGTHDGPLLTDTIIYANIDQKLEKVTLVSIPRDLWVPDLKAKINTAYAYGEKVKDGSGLLLVRAAVEKILNQPIDYALKIDFNGFTKAIDLIGGIDVQVENSFEDLEYPISGKENDACGFSGDDFEQRATSSAIPKAFPCRYKSISFSKGLDHMTGQRALEFVRSRHAVGLEGSDFARAKRQDLVIQAFKDKTFSISTFLNPGKLEDLYNLFQDSVHTNIRQEEYDDFIKLAQKIKGAKTETVVFSYSNSYVAKPSIFINPVSSEQYANQWVLIPRAGNGDFSEVQNYVDCILNSGSCPPIN